MQRQLAVIVHFKPLSMTYFRTAQRALALLFVCFVLSNCTKNETEFTNQNTLSTKTGKLVTDWTALNLELSKYCNGYYEPITSRAMYYTALTLYESVRFGLPNSQSLQSKVNGFKTTLPQPDPTLQYNFIIVANQALFRTSLELFKPAGAANLEKITALKELYLKNESSELDADVIHRSVALGNDIGWKMVEFSQQDGQASAYLHLYPVMGASNVPGCWRPTPPDYTAKALLPTWGESTLCLSPNEEIIKACNSNAPVFSESNTSIIYSEAFEVYSLSKNLDSQQRDLLQYWNAEDDFHASPLLHNYLLMNQLIQEKQLTLEQASKLFVRLSVAMYDGYIVAWNIKYKTNLMRPASYIRMYIERYYVPEYQSPPYPEYVSDKAMVYGACSIIFSETFGYRFPFMDYTQTMRNDLRENRKYFESFQQMAQEAAYSDLLNATQFRTSVVKGLEAGTSVGLNTMKIDL